MKKISFKNYEAKCSIKNQPVKIKDYNNVIQYIYLNIYYFYYNN